MLQVDPYASSFNSLTPFNYAGNSPVMINDPTGGYMDHVLDRATVGLGDDYLGGPRNFSSPGLDYYKDWTASLRSTEMNFVMMGESAFEEFYGVDLSSKEDKERIAIQIARENGMSFNAADVIKVVLAAVRTVGMESYKDHLKDEIRNKMLASAATDADMWKYQTQGGWFEDKEGEFLFDHWLDGSGDPLSFTDGSWGEYMKADGNIWRYIDKALLADSKTRTDDGVFSKTIFAETSKNDYVTGYGLLHGTTHLFLLVSATVTDKSVEYWVFATWNDEINPNKKYFTDRLYSGILKSVFNPKDYRVSISWTQTFEGYTR